MTPNHDALKDDLLSVLGASRELSPAHDGDLAELFLSRLEPPRRPRRGIIPPTDPTLYAALAALGVLVAVPVVMIVETYSARDGYLPPLDAGALPAVYWIALAAALIVLAGKAIGSWSGWHLHLFLDRPPR
jgi:hypothetical protein